MFNSICVQKTDCPNRPNQLEFMSRYSIKIYVRWELNFISVTKTARKLRFQVLTAVGMKILLERIGVRLTSVVET